MKVGTPSSLSARSADSRHEQPEAGAGPRILLVTSRGLPPERAVELRASCPQADWVVVPDEAGAIEGAIAGAEAIIGCPRPLFGDHLLDLAGGRLRWIHVGGAGIEEFLTDGLVRSDVTLTNGKIIQGPEVADHAFALLLTLTRNLHYILRSGSPSLLPRPVELRGKTAAVFGLGGIGMLIAERAYAFGMRVVGVNPDYVPMLRMFDEVVGPERRLEVLPDADAVFCAVPSTEATRPLFGAPEFDAMRESAYFVNVSRGALVDTEALAATLEAGRLSGVGLDVTDPEPLAEDHPLRRFERVVITPHSAGLSDWNRERSFELIRHNVSLFVAGRPLCNVVNKKLGY